MSNLEKLTLYLTIKNRGTFIDGNHFENEILVHMSRLNTFIFYIFMLNTNSNGAYIQTTEEIQYSFNNSRWSQIKYWFDHFFSGNGVYNVFSLPFTMKSMDGITNSFPGGIFPSVNYLSMVDIHPFEHGFFKLIARAFPLTSKLIISNHIPQQHRQSVDNNNDQNSSVVVYPHLRTLYLREVHIDYVEEFLHENNTRLLSLTHLLINYEKLATVTNNFTNDKTRFNCAHVKNIRINEAIVYPKDFYLYFPSM
jgi:hypothetical protein